MFRFARNGARNLSGMASEEAKTRFNHSNNLLYDERLLKIKLDKLKVLRYTIQAVL